MTTSKAAKENHKVKPLDVFRYAIVILVKKEWNWWKDRLCLVTRNFNLENLGRKVKKVLQGIKIHDTDTPKEKVRLSHIFCNFFLLYIAKLSKTNLLIQHCKSYGE